MKRRFTILTAALALLAFLAIPMGMRGQTRAEVVAYTLEPATGSNNSYAGNCDITIDGIIWNLTGNSQQIPWRIGGKNLAGVDRTLYSKTPIQDNVTKIEVTHGSVTLTAVNSWTVIVASDASFNTIVSTLTPTFTANATTTINRPDGADWSNCYYKFVYNVTAGGSNQYLQFSGAVFYKQEGSGSVIATPTFSPAAGTYTETQSVTLSCETENSTIYYTTDGSTPDNTSTQYNGAITVSETTTIKAIAYVGDDASSVASATYNIVQPLTTMQAIFDKATEVGNTATYAYITLGNWVVSGVSTNGKNVFVTDGTKGFVIYDGGGNTGFATGNILSGTVYCKVQLYNGFAELTLLNSTTDGVSVTTGGTVTAANIAMADLAGVNTGALVHYENLTCSIDNNKYYLSDGTTTIQVYNSIYAFGSTLVADHVYNITGVYQQYTTNNANTKEVLPRSAADIEEVVSAEPSVTVTPTTINAPYEGAEGTLALTYENIEEFISFDYYFCDAEGEELEEGPDWIYAEIQEEDDTYSLYYLIDANDGAARTAYLKVYTFDDNFEEVYAIVTINQAEFVIDYAELPFEWSSFDETPTGITNNGVTINNYLKFDTSGDNIILKFNERPGTLEFEVKGNPGNNGWAGTFKVQTSVDGVSYTDLQTYTELPTTEYQPESFATLDETVRYIKWVYTEKVSGNVAVNYIYLAAYEAPVPAITVESTTITATAEETEGSLNVTYTAIETDLGIDIYWFESDGTTAATEPAWILAEVNSELNVDYVIEANNGEARTAYFKLYGLDGEANSVYSELVTITQAAAPQQYTLTVEPFENLEIITFVDDEMVLETAGEIQVNEGAHIMLSIVADEGYVMETLMVNGVNHVNDIAEDFTYEFDMPAEAVTISATALEQVAPVGGDYVRITSLDQLTDGSIVVIAARYDEEHTNGYYAMSNATSGKPTGVLFTSTISGDNEILPASITDNEDNYYWTVNETENGFTFTNSEGFMIGYNSSTNFATGGNNTEWSIELSTSEGTAMVPNYTGFFITNVNNQVRHFALNSSHNFGPYHDNNINNSGYNFCLDFFVQSEDAPVTETHTLTINGYEAGSTGGYYLIASPVTVDPASVDGMTDGDFDLYYFDQNEELEWVNYKAGENQINANFGNLTPGKGYLYAKQATTEGEIFHFELTGEPYSGNGKITLSKSDGVDWEGWNLVGNPFAQKAYPNREFYVMKDDGTEIVPAERDTVGAMEGIFVIAANDGEEMQFSTSPIGSKGQIVLNVTQNRGNVVDRAIVRFGQGGTLPKFMLNPNNTKMYIQMDDNDYAVVRSNKAGELPVNFEAAQNGTFTISVNTENLNVKYLHLIDRATGMDTDLLQTPSYKFDARTNDDPRRFVLVFKTGINIFDVFTTNSGNKEIFSFFSDGNWIINNEGEAILQVVDVNGRILSSEEINGSVSKRIEAAPGVYMLRLVNGDNVKVQKVVVK